MTSSSRFTGYPWVLVTICHRRGYSCSCRLSSKPRGGSTKCTNFYVMIIYNTELPICAKGEWEKITYSCNPGFVLLASDCFQRGKWKLKMLKDMMDSGASFLQNEEHWVPGQRGNQAFLTDLPHTETTGRRGHDIFIEFLLWELSCCWWLDLCFNCCS